MKKTLHFIAYGNTMAEIEADVKNVADDFFGCGDWRVKGDIMVIANTQKASATSYRTTTVMAVLSDVPACPDYEESC